LYWSALTIGELSPGVFTWTLTIWPEVPCGGVTFVIEPSLVTVNVVALRR